MNVAEAARKYQVSKQAIYAQLNKMPNRGKDGSTGVLTADAVKLLDALYQTKSEETTKSMTIEVNRLNDCIVDLKQEQEHYKTEVERYKSQVKAMQDEITRLNELLNAQKQANEILSVQLEAEKDRVKDLQDERFYLRSQLDKAIVPALPAAGSTERKGFFARIFK